MRVGFRFYRGDSDTPVTLWSTLPGPTKSPTKALDTRHGRIAKVDLTYSDFEVSECKLHFENPSDELIRHLLSIVIAEPNAVENEVEWITGSVWIQDPRFGYDPVPIFHGIILDVQHTFEGAISKATVTMQDVRRIANLARDAQDFQNMTDDQIAGMLSVRMSEAGGEGSISRVEIDPWERQRRRTMTTTGAIRRYAARLWKKSSYEKIVYYAFILGFRVTASVGNDNGKPFTLLQFAPLGLEEGMALASGTYARGDGEVISFSPQYDPPGNLMTRNVNARRFDAANEIMWLMMAKNCHELRDGIVTDKNGDEVKPQDVAGLGVPNDGPGGSGAPFQRNFYSQNTVFDAQTGKPTEDFAEVSRRVESAFADNIRLLGFPAFKAGQWPKLLAYHDRIAMRNGIFLPGQTATPFMAGAQDATQLTNSPAGSGDMESGGNFNEAEMDSGQLFWRFTANLVVRFNPLLTTTDYLRMEGFGVWDAVWGIRSISHSLGSDDPTTTLSMTFGDPVKSS